MKYFVVLVFLICCISLNAVDILSADFTTVLPAGWTQTGSTNTHWQYSNTTQAGGASGELMFNWSPGETGTFRYISAPFNTTKAYDMVVSFKHNADMYAESLNLSLQISTNLTTWNTVWSTNATADIPAQTVNATIPWNWGNSTTTYLAFVVSGNSYNLNYWWIDDVLLSYSNTLGSGLWSDATYYPAGNVIVPSGQTLTLQQGITLNMASNSTMLVQGSLKALGTGQQKINITTSGASTLWAGIDIFNVAATNDSTILNWCVIQRSTDSAIEVENSPKVRISNCELKNNSVTGSGGGIRCLNSNMLVYGCFINANSSTADGSGVYWEGGSPRFDHNRIVSNSISVAYQHGALTFKNCDLNSVSNNILLNNSFASNTGAIYLYSCTGTLKKHLVANNSGFGIYVNSSTSNWLDIDHCDLVNNGSYGLYTSAYVKVYSSIIWGNPGGDNYEIYNTGNVTRLQVYNCCVKRGIYGIYGINSANYQSCISSDPLFVDPTDGPGTGYDAYSANWRLQDMSPCIDAGSYLTGFYDEDFSAPDIGMYARKLKPGIYSANDVTPDQGHQIDLRWYPTDKDTSWDPSAWYHIFRSTDERAGDLDGAVIVTDPRQISQDLISSSGKICWIHNDRIFTYLGQMKAMNRSAYSMIVPTLQDSSSTGTHGEVFVVTYFDNVYFWDSVGLYGYSVDNIPPMTPSGATLSRINGENFRLEWQEVTEGSLNGNSYPETNAITYLIYASDDPNFVPGQETFVTSTTNLSVVLSEMGDQQRFYRIIASDSQ
ncbi:MAG TPA: right-handed parallel beta-helix repeat-containing protein [Candidatus Cloacimonadota bacterium]|nr:right-handed parallel beta-helix repeat-containing protein [Candidatus Cloacimonadota bacterium]